MATVQPSIPDPIQDPIQDPLQNVGIIIVDKTGILKTLTVKDYKEEELFKKCGFKKPDNFSKQHEWTVKMDKKKYLIAVFAKIEGKANTENKYDFPPPIDTTLFFGSCAIVCRVNSEENKTVFTLMSCTIAMWDKLYEKLFGGFEDLVATSIEDEHEVDELAGVPSDKKTKDGYLKDGFVIDSDSGDDEKEYDSSESSDEVDGAGSEDDEDDVAGLAVEDIGSELSSEEYDTDSSLSSSK
jgi:hypothetical protein